MNKAKMHEIFAAIDFPEECPADCYWLVATPDNFNTGDSPTSYECVCESVESCPIVINRKGEE